MSHMQSDQRSLLRKPGNLLSLRKFRNFPAGDVFLPTIINLKCKKFHMGFIKIVNEEV